MRYYNADGGEAEMCGNGARCFARFASRLAGRTDAISFETMAGVVGAELLGENVRLNMSQPKDLALGAKLRAWRKSHRPFREHGRAARDRGRGKPRQRRCRPHRRSDPLPRSLRAEGHDANFIEVQGPRVLAIRTYERGVEGETLACGTGVCAAALIHSALTGAASPIEVRVKGGDTLSVGFTKTGDTFTDVTLTGPADFVFDGTVAL